jgi:pectate lyase
MHIYPIKHLLKRSLQLLTLAVGFLFAAHSAHAQSPSYQQSLLNERVGFGRNATGGATGEVYWVTSLADDYDPTTGAPRYGNLRWGLEHDDNFRWIMFAVNGTINVLGSPIQVHSNKTIDARGASITLTNYGLWIGRYDVNGQFHGSSNVIVENLNLSNGTTTGTILNAIMIEQGATNVWVDHCTFINLPKMGIDVTTANPSYTTDVTVSWCRFSWSSTGFNSPMLVGADPYEQNGQNMRVTLHHNFFDRQTQRSPMVRFGKFHCFNNYLYDWDIYGMASFSSAQLYTENNIFYAIGDTRAVLVDGRPQEPTLGFAKNINNWLINGAATVDYNAAAVFNPASYYPYTAETANSNLQSSVATFAGATRTSGTLANMSTRANVQGGQGNLISGFNISGSPSDTKRVIIRAIGPSLAHYFPNAMGNPTLKVYNVYGQQIAYNDNWGDSQRAEIQATGLAPSNGLEAAWVGYLSPGTYSAVIDGWGTGIANLEIYDLQTSSPAKLVNISSRATVDPSNPPIAGFIAQSGWSKLLIRGIGPSLAQFGIQNPISDPTLTLTDANGTQIAYNNNWQDAPSGVSQLGFAPSDWRESVIVTNLAPGNYTVILRDYYGSWGIGSIELYKL